MGGQKKHMRDETFLKKTWTFKDAGKGKTDTLPADNYEFPFDIILQGSLPESLEGLADNCILYRFKAEINRKYSKDIVVRKPLRIIRTLDPTDLELSHIMVSACTWTMAVLEKAGADNCAGNRKHLARQTSVLDIHAKQSRHFWDVSAGGFPVGFAAQGSQNRPNIDPTY